MKTIKTLIEIPAKYKWITVDEDGMVTIWIKKPKIDYSFNIWFRPDFNYVVLFKTNPPKDWTKAIWRIEEYEEVL